eukprot:151607_1
MNNIYMNVEEKYEETKLEEVELVSCHTQNEQIEPYSTLSVQAEFVKANNSDYIDCQNKQINDHRIEDCKVMKRIAHLLKYYQQNPHVDMYEYLSSLKNYDVPTFMEDWYQTKNNHLRDNEHDVEWVVQNMNLQCDDVTSCEYARRYQRERGNEIYDNMKIQIDFKNIMLKDQLDSIHTFIFHTIQRRNMQREYKTIQSKHDNEQKSNQQEEKEEEQSIWADQPESISQCNIEQIIWIIDNGIFDKLKPNARDNLIPHKLAIIKRIKESKYDGSKLQEMGRKTFMNKLATLVDNKKLKAPLAALYTTIMKCDIIKLFQDDKHTKEDIWSDKPHSIQHCNVNQIAYIINHILAAKTHKLAE